MMMYCYKFKQIWRLILLFFLSLSITIPLFSLPAQPQTPASNPRVLLEQGIERYEAEEFAQAVNIWEEAAYTLSLEQNRLLLALVLSNLGIAYQNLGQWQTAEDRITQSLHLLDNSPDLANSSVYLEIRAKALNHRGSLEWAKGQLDSALETWKQATKDYAQAQNQMGVVGSLINQARAMQALGFNRQASEVLQQVRQNLQQTTNQELRVTGLYTLGSALRRMGRLTQSQEVLHESLQSSQGGMSEASVLLELGNTERALGRRARARNQTKEDQSYQDYTKAAIAYYEETIDLSEAAAQIPAQLNLLSLLIESAQDSEAVQLASEIQPAITNLPATRSAIYARLNFAQSLTCLQPGTQPEGMRCRRQKPPETSIDETTCIYQKPPETRTEERLSHDLPWKTENIAQMIATAVEEARRLQDPRTESYALGQLGGLYELTQQWKEAQDLTQDAILIAQQIQVPEILYRWEWQLGRLFKKQGDITGAIEAYRLAVETVKQVRTDLLTIDSEVQFSFRDDVEPIYREFVDLLLQPSGGEVSQDNLQTAIETIDELQLSELENFLSCDLSQTIKISPEIDTIDPKAALIYPIILPDRLDVIFKLPGQPLKYYTNPVTEIEVEVTLKILRCAIGRGNGGTVTEKAKRVYQWLIEPLEQELAQNQKVETLVFVLDGYLRNIPMAVLYDQQKKEYLVQKQYALSILPGLQLFDLQAQSQSIEILGAGISEIINVDDLKFEALDIQPELDGIGSREILLNSQFTPQNLQEKINSNTFSILHIATHGEFSSDPEQTFILFYGSEESTGELLKAEDFNNLLRSRTQQTANPLELLVLSACQTAEGDERATLGLAGLAVRSGARSTLATLWSVEDESTVQFMQKFYQELRKVGTTKAQALHRAQKSFLAQPTDPEHHIWAPYILVGSWR